LLESDDIFVAQIGDDIVGIVASGLVDQTNIQKISTRKNISSLEKILSITEPDSIFLKYIQTLEINEFLLEKSQENYDADLNLLIVKE
ncbi:MAG: GNAT family N-acetyltransferase, partial [Desemzia incerta]